MRYHERFGELPDVRIFRQSFPEMNYPLPTTWVTEPELVDLARDAVNWHETQIGWTEAPRYINANDPVTTAKIMLETAERVRSEPDARHLRPLSLADIDNLPDPEILIDHGTVASSIPDVVQLADAGQLQALNSPENAFVARRHGQIQHHGR